MTKEQVIEKLKEALPQFPIKRAWLFGSYATDEATAKSDIDILVDYEIDDNFTIVTIGTIIGKLSQIMGKQVDVVENGSLLPFAQKHAEETKIFIYEKEP